MRIVEVVQRIAGDPGYCGEHNERQPPVNAPNRPPGEVPE